MRLALAQIHIEPADVDGNVGRAVDAIDRAAAREADLVVLPEIFNVGYFAFQSYARYAEGLDGETLSRVAEVAADRGVAVLAGSIVEDLAETDDGPASTGLANTAVLFDAAGERQSVYRKHHLFGYESMEAELLVPGESLPTAEVGGFTVGTATCYDLRFPGLIRRLAGRGATLIAVPSAWPYPRIEHWTVLSRARAIENLLFVATANGAGTFESATLLGRSTVYGPWGTTVASTHDEPDLVVADIDQDRVASIRAEFPAWDDRRLEAERFSDATD